jgi:hypothetical protein
MARCNKSSILHIQNSLDEKPVEIVWLIDEVGMLTSKLTELLSDLSSKVDIMLSGRSDQSPDVAL